MRERGTFSFTISVKWGLLVRVKHLFKEILSYKPFRVAVNH